MSSFNSPIVSRELTAAYAALAKARADKAEAELAEFAAPADTLALAFYAGLKLDKLSVGPLPNFDAALEAARHEHGAGKTIFVVEAAPPVPIVAPFGSGEIDRVLHWIETDNAFPFGPDAVLPPLRSHHLDDLAKRLNAAVTAWMEAGGIKMISARLGEATNISAVIPHEVDSVTVTKLPDGPSPALTAAVLERCKASVDDFLGDLKKQGAIYGDPASKPMRVVVADEVDPYPEPSATPHHETGPCEICPAPLRCATRGCVASIDEGCLRDQP